MENDENVVEETTQENQSEDTPQVDENKFESVGDDSVIKVDLSKPPKKEEVVEELEAKEDSTDEKPQEEKEEEKEEVVLEEITDEKVDEKVEELEEKIEEAVVEAEKSGKEIPENIQKLMDFMEETGGDLEDYVKLNQNYDNLEDLALLKEYYKKTKSHLRASCRG